MNSPPILKGFSCMSRPIALITGITGQDGSYLAELLLAKGYEVHGLVRRNSHLFNYHRIGHLHGPLATDRKVTLHYGDLTDAVSLVNILATVHPHEIYNLAAQSHVHVSFETPLYTSLTSGVGVLNLIEAVRTLNLSPKIYQASTSEMFSGDRGEAPQHEKTPFRPKSPYGVAKMYACEIGRIYRESYGMFISNGILFNHESERRGENFVTRKITIGLRDILLGKTNEIVLGNLEARRDWGYAPEYVEAMWRMLQLPAPDDFVIATGETHSVREFAEAACELVGLDFNTVIREDARYRRPNEVHYLCGNSAKAETMLGWKPKTRFKELVRIMMEKELQASGLSLSSPMIQLPRVTSAPMAQSTESSTQHLLDLTHQKILVTGGNGFIGRAVVETLLSRGVPKNNIIIPDSTYDDLRNLENCRRLISYNQITVVFHLAAIVGGVGFSSQHPATQYYNNVLMDLQLMEAVKNLPLKKVILVSSSCAYPLEAPYPLTEESLWDGLPQETNRAYGVGKRILTVQAEAYHQEYGVPAVVVVPNNAYGPGDNFDIESGHVIPGLIRKCIAGTSPLVVWGDGTPTRDFLYVKDFAEGVVLAAERLQPEDGPVNLGSGVETRIADLVKLISELTGFAGEIVHDTTKPNGQPRRSVSIERAKKLLGFSPHYSLRDGLTETIRWYHRQSLPGGQP